jgi:hypothetical protein
MGAVIDRAAVRGEKSKTRKRSWALNWRRTLALAVNLAVWAIAFYALYRFLHHGH